MVEIIVALIASATTIITLVINIINKNKVSAAEETINHFNNMPPLIQNSIHINIYDYIRKAKVIDIEKIDNYGRRKLAIDFLTESLEAWIEPIETFSKMVDECTLKCDTKTDQCNRLYREAMVMFEKGLSYYEKDYRKMYNEEDSLSLHIFRNKFIHWNRERVERLAQKISDVCKEDDVYKTCQLKGNRILEAIDDFLFDTIKDASFTIMKLNGELSGKSYKGHIL